MGKGSVMVYIAVTGLLLFLISQNSTTTKPSHHRHHRRLKLRSNFTFSTSKTNNNNNNNNSTNNNRHEPIPFDPLVADIERKREDRQWEREYFRHAHKETIDDVAAQAAEGQPEWEDFTNAEDYLNDEEKFNVTNRLVLLFPKVDVDPVDGYATEHELTEWILKNSEREVMHRTEREMEVHDKNHDGLVSFHEYDPPAWARNSDNDSFGYEMGWWKGEHFNASDANGDGFLNLTEYNDFMHPADSKNPKLLQWLCQEEIRERDSDKDGKVNFKEFFHGLFDTLRNYEEDSHDSSHDSEESSEAPAKKLFSELDKDGDRYLSAAELLPVIDKFHPSERYYAKQQADYMISQADSDKDGRLTLAEMIDHPYVFYSAIFNEDEEDDYDLHDEFR